MKKITVLILIAVMLGSCVCALAEKGAPDIPPVLVTQPKDVTVDEGGKCSFSVGQTGARGITWRLREPETNEIILCTNANAVFPELGISGKNGETLTLSNVPAALNGWQAYCTLSNNTGRTVSRYATITVNSQNGTAPAADPAPGSDPVPEADIISDTVPASDEGEPEADVVSASPAPETSPEKSDRLIHVKAIGCILQELDSNGNPLDPSESEMIFRGCADFRVTCNAKQAKYWIINGVRYRFEDFPKNFTVIGLKEDMTIECCSGKTTPETLLSKEMIQRARTGETLTVSGEGVKLCHVRNSTTGTGGYFDSFDFTNDYTNLASGKQETGGRITVKANVSKSGASFKHWLFNGAHIIFSVPQSYFFADELNTSMVYAVSEEKAKPDGSGERVIAASDTGNNGAPKGEDAPAGDEQSSQVTCTVTCTGCTFTGAGYRNAEQGTVPLGTKITFTAPAGKSITVNGIRISGSVTITVYNNITAEGK